ncbi:hypothetical protein [Pseudomonas japonica]|uniref:Uncharacterized protein n=1 Tax=Pseudomonas japonica TaxID=256466 RepID=A0A239IL17_9PSED|nr:hypothetical protein [Pseudomonas japonica]SNS94231.1 hypothetical protein SAMN05444352_11950 [Pseudomonas japonica]
MALVKNPGANCTVAFDRAFSTAHLRARSGPAPYPEPDLVQHLISRETLRTLNRQCSSLYDRSQNIVRFRGVFLHSSPMASYMAGSQSCCRELADAMFVVYVSEPDANGMHVIVRRSAFLLMFKKTGSRRPRAFRYDPGGGIDPQGTDQQQFYLYNQWPRFELRLAHNGALAGVYDINTGGVPHDIGKYALVWDPRAGRARWSIGTQDVHWLAGQPVPRFPMDPSTTSLGRQLEALIDGAPGTVGRDFSPRPAAAGDWDGLMGTLLGYPSAPGIPAGGSLLDHSKWKGVPRHVNPAALGLMSFGSSLGMERLEHLSLVQATLRQELRDGYHSPYLPGALRRSSRALNRLAEHLSAQGSAPCAGARRFPVLIASVTRFNSAERRPVAEKRADQPGGERDRLLDTLVECVFDYL